MSGLNTIEGTTIFSYLEKRHTLWSPFLGAGRKFVEQESWARARESFNHTLRMVEEMMVGGDERQANLLKGAALVCVGAQALCEDDLKRATEQFRHSEDPFRRGRDNYGRALSLMALGITHELEQEWHEVFPLYDRARKILGAMIEPEAQRLEKFIQKRAEDAVKKWRHEMGGDADTTSPPPAANVELEFLPVFGDIPAGNPHLIPEYVETYIKTDRLWINDVPHYIWNHSDTHLCLDFSPDVSYAVLRVSGDSMNNAGINERDYVLLRTMPNSSRLKPKDGEVVAVALVEQDYEITLKRFRRRGRTVSFEPESTNPVHEPYTFETVGDSDTHLSIKGILVAILKPMQLSA